MNSIYNPNSFQNTWEYRLAGPELPAELKAAAAELSISLDQFGPYSRPQSTPWDSSLISRSSTSLSNLSDGCSSSAASTKSSSTGGGGGVGSMFGQMAGVGEIVGSVQPMAGLVFNTANFMQSRHQPPTLPSLPTITTTIPTPSSSIPMDYSQYSSTLPTTHPDHLNLHNSTESTLSAPGVEIPWYSMHWNRCIDPKEFFCDTVTVENASIVAQIVGKQGAKIKHLIAKYSASIHTPMCANGEEPVFVIKGKRRNVYLVKDEIQKAEKHFLAIEKAKKEKMEQIMNATDASTLKVFVPSHYIGLIVGRNGRVVREWQLLYNVYIETPKFEHTQFFAIHGSAPKLSIVAHLIYEQIIKRSHAPLLKTQRTPNEISIEELVLPVQPANPLEGCPLIPAL